jgi:hypothetical protein
MAKKRKTREQKRLADLRHTFTHIYAPVASATASSFNLKQTISNKSEVKTITIPHNAYPFLKKDLSKTALLTLGILIAQALLFIVLKNHIFVIWGINY